MSFTVSEVWRLVESARSTVSGFVKVRLVTVFLLVIAAAAFTAMCPVALKLIVDGVSGASSRTHASLAEIIAIYVLCQWLAKVAVEARGLVYARVEQRTLRVISERLFAHVMRLPLRFHLDRQTGAVSQTLGNGLEGARLLMHHVVFTVLPVCAELGTEIVVLGHLVSLQLLLLFCAAIICYSVIFCCSAGKAARAGRAAAAARIGVSAAMTDVLLNFETVKCFTAEELVQERISRELVRCEERWVSFYRQYSTNGVLVACVFATFLAATISLAATEVYNREITIGEFVLVNAYMLQLARPIEMLGFAVQGMIQGAAMLEEMKGLFRESHEKESASVRNVVDRGGAIVFAEVSVAYRAERPVLKKLSFRIEEGCTLAIVGMSGSGKSTVVRLLMRLLEPDSGEIEFDGAPISSLPLSDLRRAVAVVPQDSLLLNDTLRNNIAFGRPGATQDEIENAARVARLHDFILALPDGYETIVGERGIKISGGERQRISIARAVLRKPRVYVFDEATSSLDSRTEGEILSALQQISGSRTTLMIAHRLSTVVNADEIIVLEAGQVVERGTHGGLLRSNGKYAALWRSQREGTVAA